MTAGSRPEPRPSASPPGWKVLLAVLSLALSLLLWLNGLIDSLGRPSVGNALNRRQLELAVLAEPSLPPALRPLLAGREPLASLEQALKEEIRQAEENGTPPAAELLLEQALLLRRQGHPEQAAPLLDQLSSSASPEARLAKALQGTDGTAPELSQPLPSQAALLRLWSCEALQARSSPASAGTGPCEPEQASRAAARQLLAVTVLPVLVLLLGVAALLRELWLRWRRKALPASPLAGPPLTGLDAVLLIAGGFVVVGELLTPLLISPLLGALLGDAALTAPLREGLRVMGLYLALMAGPLLILALMLRGVGRGPAEGWLQFRWRPLASSLRPALRTFLMVLPLVSLVGWLQGQIWGDPGGSNPLLELVLNSHNLPALTCFGITAIVLAPLFEETIFRGVLLPVAARQLGAPAGVLISAVVFAVAHLSLGELLPLLVLGLGLGWLRWQGGRLGSCVLMHSFWNALTFANLVVLGW